MFLRSYILAYFVSTVVFVFNVKQVMRALIIVMLV